MGCLHWLPVALFVCHPLHESAPAAPYAWCWHGATFERCLAQPTGALVTGSCPPPAHQPSVAMGLSPSCFPPTPAARPQAHLAPSGSRFDGLRARPLWLLTAIIQCSTDAPCAAGLAAYVHSAGEEGVTALADASWRRVITSILEAVIFSPNSFSSHLSSLD